MADAGCALLQAGGTNIRKKCTVMHLLLDTTVINETHCRSTNARLYTFMQQAQYMHDKHTLIFKYEVQQHFLMVTLFFLKNNEEGIC